MTKRPDKTDYVKLAVEQGDAELQRIIAGTKSQPAHTAQQAHVEVVLLFIAARRQAHLTQAQLAAKAGMSQPSLARIETGKVSPSLRTLLTLAAALDVRLTVQPAGQ